MQNNQIPASEMADMMQQIHVLMAKYHPGRFFDPHEIQQQQPRFEAAFFDEYAQACLNSARDSHHLHGLSYPYTDAYLLPFIGWMAVNKNGQAAMLKKNGFGSHRDLPDGLCRWHVFAGGNRCPVYTLADSIAASNEFVRQYRQTGALYAG